ncbi:hypothetical protein GAMM_170099 [Gammaproteobacteria bacterium]
MNIKKLIAKVTFIIFYFIGLFLSPVTIFATENGKMGIYLCTKDLDSIRSLSYVPSSYDGGSRDSNQDDCKVPSEIYNNTKSDGIFIPYRGLNGKCQAKLRHCFIVLARENMGKDSNNIDNREMLNLVFIDSFGFGVDKEGKPATYTESIFSGSDPSYKKQAISCEPVFSENDLTEEYLERYKENNTAINHKWADAVSVMDGEVVVGYALFSHNCCTVAIKAVKEIGVDIDTIEHMYDINYGIGIKIIGTFDVDTIVRVLGSKSFNVTFFSEKKE